MSRDFFSNHLLAALIPTSRFSKLREDIHSLRCQRLLWQFAAGVSDTGGKFFFVVDTDSKFAADVSTIITNLGKNAITGAVVLLTPVVHLELLMALQTFEKFKIALNYYQGPGECRFMKDLKLKTSVHCPFTTIVKDSKTKDDFTCLLYKHFIMGP